MIRHLFKLIWNRKKSNILITTEILGSFLVLFIVITMIIFNINRYRQPIGFDYRNVWWIEIDSKLPFDSIYNEEKRQSVQQLLSAMQQLPEITGVAGWAIPPYSGGMSTYADERNGRLVRVAIHDGTVDAKDVLGLTLTEGRWFEENDKALNWIPVVINESLRKEAFGNESPLGKSPFQDRGASPGTEAKKDHRVIGVISEFRKGGEFSEPMNVCIQFLDILETTQATSSSLLIKVKQGTTAQFEEKLVRTLESAAAGWTFDVRPLEEVRQEDFKPRFTFFIAVGLIAGFLLLMVALGLIGVLWQNVSQRTKELGLRRALGSTTKGVYRHVLGELLVLTTFGLMIGTFIIVQFPLLDIIELIPPPVYAIGLLISISLMYLLTFICGLYPSWLAMEVEPAEALHYE